MKIRYLALGAAVVLGLAACGGGGGSSSTADNNPTGETNPSGLTTGTITGFGSIFVNGIEFETDGTTFDIDGAPGMESDLEVGHVVTINGTVNPDGVTGVAQSVRFEAEVEGPISSVDLANRLFVVVGQTVMVDDFTFFSDEVIPASLEGLVAGDFVEVSGYIDADGNILATRVEIDIPDSSTPGVRATEVKGLVSALDSAASTFQINDLVVDFSMARLSGFTDGTIADGDYVEAKGTEFGPNDELIATEVDAEDKSERHDSIDGEERNDVKVKMAAAVQDVDIDAGTLMMLGITVHVDEMTRSDDRSDSDVRRFSLDDIRVGDFIEVRGDELMDADGLPTGDVRAFRMEREDSQDEVELQGAVTEFSGNSVTILGVTIDTHAGTRFGGMEGGMDDDMGISSADFFAMMSTGAVVKAKGVQVSDAGMTADKLEFED